MSTVTPLHPLLQPTLDDVKDDAARVWNERDATQHFGAKVDVWTVETAEDGQPMVTGRVGGQQAEEAMRSFANGMFVRGGDDVQRPYVDYSQPGRIECLWRTDGVWVRLWALIPETKQAPTPLLMPRRAAGQPSGRLPYRRNTTACGTRRGNTEGN